MQKPPTEYCDLLDCTGRKTGSVISRDEAHRSGAWHGAFHCLIVYPRDGHFSALFQKRSTRKRIAPGKFNVSVGGHYVAGEGPETAGPREIREELGLAVRFGELVPLGKRVFVYCFTPGVREYEFQDVFLLPKPIVPAQLVLQHEEVDAVLELPIERGVSLFSGKSEREPGTLFAPGNDAVEAAVAAEEFVPCLDNYYLKLLLLARRCLNGDREHLII